MPWLSYQGAKAERCYKKEKRDPVKYYPDKHRLVTDANSTPNTEQCGGSQPSLRRAGKNPSRNMVYHIDINLQ